MSKLTRESRDLVNKAQEIEDAVYDPKAVNPHCKLDVDEHEKICSKSSKPGEGQLRRR